MKIELTPTRTISEILAEAEFRQSQENIMIHAPADFKEFMEIYDVSITDKNFRLR